MAAIDSAAGMNGPLKELIARVLWEVLDAHADHPIWTVRILFIKKTFRVRDLQSVFEWLVGPRPLFG